MNNFSHSDFSSLPDPNSVAQSSVYFPHRAILLDFSPSGDLLAAVEGKNLVLRRVKEGFPQIKKISLGRDRPLAVSFAGEHHLALLAVSVSDPAEPVLLRAFLSQKDWAEGDSREFDVVFPRYLAGHREKPWVLVAPDHPLDIGAYDLETAESLGGGGPLNGADEDCTITWAEDRALCVELGELSYWNIEEKKVAETREVGEEMEDLDISQVAWRKDRPPFIGFAVPPQVAALGEEPLILDKAPHCLFQILSGKEQMVTIILHRKGQGSPYKTEVVTLKENSIQGRSFLSWPYSGAALHPTLPLLAWLKGKPGKAALQLHHTKLHKALDLKGSWEDS